MDRYTKQEGVESEVEISDGLLYLLVRRGRRQEDYQRQELNLLREHKGLPPIADPHDTPVGRTLNDFTKGMWNGFFAFHVALFMFCVGFIPIIMLGLSPFVAGLAGGYLAISGWRWGWRIGAALDRAL